KPVLDLHRERQRLLEQALSACLIPALSGPFAQVAEAAGDAPAITDLPVQLQRLLQHRLRARSLVQSPGIHRPLAQSAGNALFVPDLPEERQALLITGSGRARILLAITHLPQVEQ